VRAIVCAADGKGRQKDTVLLVSLSVLLVLSILGMAMFAGYAVAAERGDFGETTGQVLFATACEEDVMKDENSAAVSNQSIQDASAASLEQIEDGSIPMGAFDEPHCWVHWATLLGILLTTVYGIVVVRRRLRLANEVVEYERWVYDARKEQVEAAHTTETMQGVAAASSFEILASPSGSSSALSISQGLPDDIFS
jgi:hypothetical protein